MKLHRAFALLAVSVTLSGPVRAEEPFPPAELDRFRDMVKPADVDLFFNYLRDAMKAGIAGKTPPPPPAELSRRAEELTESIKQQGLSTLDQMLEMIRQEMKNNLPPPPPPATPSDQSPDKPDYRT